ncbi:MAG: Panacea domain-containing protein [Cyclobacteriaceae bacterium]
MSFIDIERYLGKFFLGIRIALKITARRVEMGNPAMSVPIAFRFDALKTVQVAALFLKLHGGTMKFLGLLKLLYMADRLAFKKIDQPITGDKYYSMDKGPVLSTVYDFIKDNKRHETDVIWKEYISTRNNSSKHEVKLLKDPGVDEFSDEEEEIIKEVYEKWGKCDRFELVNLTHEFPEWEFPNGGAIPINVANILKNVGKTQEEIDYIEKIAAREMYLDRLLNE